MGGLAVLLLLLFYLYVAVKVSRAFSGPTSSFVLIGFLAFPFLDALIGRMYLRLECANRGEISVFNVARNVEGIDLRGSVSADDWSRWGYRFIEGGINRQGLVSRVEQTVDGPKLEIGVKPRAEYYLSLGAWTEGVLFESRRTSVRYAANGYELGGYDDVAFNGGWAERVAMFFSDAGPGHVASCPVKTGKLIELLHKVAEPAP